MDSAADASPRQDPSSLLPAAETGKNEARSTKLRDESNKRLLLPDLARLRVPACCANATDWRAWGAYREQATARRTAPDLRCKALPRSRQRGALSQFDRRLLARIIAAHSLLSRFSSTAEQPIIHALHPARVKEMLSIGIRPVVVVVPLQTGQTSRASFITARQEQTR